MVESEYNWNPLRDYFKDESHPCRLPFDSTWNFDRGVHRAILDEKVQRHFRDLQIATQFNRCCLPVSNIVSSTIKCADLASLGNPKNASLSLS